MWENFLNQQKSRRIAVVLALLGTVTPLAGIHKFYLGQPLWGILYFILNWSTPMAQIACAIEAVWFFVQDLEQFNVRFNDQLAGSRGVAVKDIATAVRELDQLRLDGLISEYEFEQKRRQLIDRIS
ncbi:MAG: NINE protein [Gomphosphaeria aponina SAG 52.96 = DSM 107014]|uniref:NINE protein n=1 Tax=Gomphosphaeria aponina SAG 52.96 = DSM 107014 TaxID=1521640 RepID=A0A941GNX1_9CHRO|nr:NINE protein [Gomphosphaeria aponina SAG 52.96 = DSM 107014]